VNKDPVGGMREYLDRFVYGPKSWTDFLDMIGIDDVLAAARAGQSLYDT
jgi:glutaconate CoA-transferase, subunit A